MEICFINEFNQEIHGILEDKGKDLIVLCHGLLSHKNTLFYREFAQTSNLSSFRFDFPIYNANNEFRYGNYDLDMKDLELVIQELEKRGHKVVGLMGHSRGASVVLHTARLRNFDFVISLAARFHMKDALKKHSEEDMNLLESNGKFDWKVQHRRQEASFEIKKSQVENFLSLDNSKLSEIPKSTRVLLIHGKKDRNIPFEDMAEIQKFIPHSVSIPIESTDHIFRNQKEAVMMHVLEFIEN